jgi:hypothetical protein
MHIVPLRAHVANEELVPFLLVALAVGLVLLFSGMTSVDDEE